MTRLPALMLALLWPVLALTGCDQSPPGPAAPAPGQGPAATQPATTQPAGTQQAPPGPNTTDPFADDYVGP